jgi:hypothetical protein
MRCPTCGDEGSFSPTWAPKNWDPAQKAALGRSYRTLGRAICPDDRTVMHVDIVPVVSTGPQLLGYCKWCGSEFNA